MATVGLRRISKRFGSFAAVNDLTIEIEDGEFLVFVGPSGCGKSTVLRLIAGLEDLTAGEIMIGGRLANHLPPRDRDIAMVFQNYALYPHMTVYENLAFPLRMRNAPRARMVERIQTVADLLEIGHLLQRKPGQLSGGQRQRVALGRAIVREPKVFLMDEPLSNLDAKLRTQTRAELIKLHRRLGTTIIYVTHDQTEAMTMGSRLAVMRDGVLQQLDTPQAIYDAPANVFVAEFIGDPPMNVFPAQVVQDEGLALVQGDFRLTVPTGLEEAIGNFAGRIVLVGIRPEHLAVEPRPNEAASSAGVFQALVEVVEPLGSEQIIHLQAKTLTLIARGDPHLPVVAGQQVDVAVRAQALMCFDRDSGLALR